MAQEAPVFEPEDSQWPRDAELSGEESTTPSGSAVLANDRRFLWGAIGLAAMAMTVGLVAFARRQGWVD